MISAGPNTRQRVWENFTLFNVASWLHAVYGYATLDTRLTKFPSPPRAGGIGSKASKCSRATPRPAGGAVSRPAADDNDELVSRAGPGSKVSKFGRATPRPAGGTTPRRAADDNDESVSHAGFSKASKCSRATPRPAGNEETTPRTGDTDGKFI